jgi:hypothetical protein
LAAPQAQFLSHKQSINDRAWAKIAHQGAAVEPKQTTGDMSTLSNKESQPQSALADERRTHRLQSVVVQHEQKRYGFGNRRK